MLVEEIGGKERRQEGQSSGKMKSGSPGRRHLQPNQEVICRNNQKMEKQTNKQT